jgi:hypothetical protein
MFVVGPRDCKFDEEKLKLYASGLWFLLITQLMFLEFLYTGYVSFVLFIPA